MDSSHVLNPYSTSWTLTKHLWNEWLNCSYRGKLLEKVWKLLGVASVSGLHVQRRDVFPGETTWLRRKSICFRERRLEFWFQLLPRWTRCFFVLSFSFLHCKLEIIRIEDKVWKVPPQGRACSRPAIIAGLMLLLLISTIIVNKWYKGNTEETVQPKV